MTISVRVHENDDLWHALASNPPATFKPEQIADIVVEVPGANDEYEWWWILELVDGKFVLLSGWCDYTGWYCRSKIDELGIYDDALSAAAQAPEKEDDSNRSIRKNLIGQLSGAYPKFTYWSE